MMEILDNKIVYNGTPLDLGHYRPIREIARGVNGIVYLAEDSLLSRQVAIKFWIKLKNKDHRDKFQQGILEAQKAYQASGKNVIQIFQAQKIDDLLYVVMEYFDSIPLSELVKKFKLPIWVRVALIEEILNTCEDLAKKGIFHGDLHSNNILIQRNLGEKQHMPKIKIIDFGTSYFAGQVFSMKRHLRVLYKLIDEVFAPFKPSSVFWHVNPYELGQAVKDSTEEDRWHTFHTLLRQQIRELESATEAVERSVRKKQDLPNKVEYVRDEMLQHVIQTMNVPSFPWWYVDKSLLDDPRALDPDDVGMPNLKFIYSYELL